jgi:hypothetical protein
MKIVSLRSEKEVAPISRELIFIQPFALKREEEERDS